MRVKLYKRGAVVNNLVAFVILSVAYLHILDSLSRGVSAISVQSVVSFISSSPLTISVMLISFVAVVEALKISKLLLPIFMLVVFVQSFAFFFQSFDKFILVLNFLYVMLAFYFYILWHMELDSAVYCPSFSERHIDKESPFGIKVQVEHAGQEKILGSLTNWDVVGCFVVIEESVMIKTLKKATSQVRLRINFEGKEFSQKGEVVSEYGGGIGVKFLWDDKKVTDYGWPEFFTVMRDRGYSINKLRV